MSNAPESWIASFVERELSSDDPEAELTTMELWGKYQSLVEAGRMRSCRFSTFTRALPKAILQIHQIRRSASLLRENRCVRGYKGISFSQPQYEPITEGEPEVADLAAGEPPPGA